MSINDIIRSFLSCELLQGKGETVIDDDDQLIDSGIIDSLGIMTMLSFSSQRTLHLSPPLQRSSNTYKTNRGYCGLLLYKRTTSAPQYDKQFCIARTQP
jgi:hypothetical protein